MQPISPISINSSQDTYMLTCRMKTLCQQQLVMANKLGSPEASSTVIFLLPSCCNSYSLMVLTSLLLLINQEIGRVREIGDGDAGVASVATLAEAGACS